METFPTKIERFKNPEKPVNTGKIRILRAFLVVVSVQTFLNNPF